MLRLGYEFRVDHFGCEDRVLDGPASREALIFRNTVELGSRGEVCMLFGEFPPNSQESLVRVSSVYG